MNLFECCAAGKQLYMSLEKQYKVGMKTNSPCDATVCKTLEEALAHLDKTLFVYRKGTALSFVVEFWKGGKILTVPDEAQLLAVAPPCLPSELGDVSFCTDLRISFPCYAGSMAHGISSAQLVQSMATAGMLGFYGTAGLSLEDLERVITHLSHQCRGKAFGVNLLNSPDDSSREYRVVELLLKHNVQLVEASAYIVPTPALVKYRVKGIKKAAGGMVEAHNHLIAKVSRLEIARRFLEPPPLKVLEQLRTNGEITPEEADLGRNLPLAQYITVEADSAGHTDHRPALSIFPAVKDLAREMHSKHKYDKSLKVGLAGGMGTPSAAAAAFSMGAAYIVTGSINQACLESGTSSQVRTLLAQAAQTDVTNAPAADLFERGGTVQVLKKGTRFAERARKLHVLFLKYDSIDDIPRDQRYDLEEIVFQKSFEDIWQETQAFFKKINPRQLDIAAKYPKHKMALIFRWYLGNAVKWACSGESNHIDDYQIWCGPAMGAFNDWAHGTFFEDPAMRSAPLVALNLLYGAALLLRLEILRAQGVSVENCQIPCPVHTFPKFMSTQEQ